MAIRMRVSASRPAPQERNRRRAGDSSAGESNTHIVVAVVIAAMIGNMLYRRFVVPHAHRGAEAAPAGARPAHGFAVLANGLISMKNILLQGKRIDAEKALRSERAVHGVPSTWQLVRRDRDGNERVLATNVASYNVGGDGSIIDSNGRGVFVRDAEGRVDLALSDQLVGEVIALRS